jgi:hypothetical protein
MPNVQYEFPQTWRKKRMSAQQQAYLDAPRRRTHIFHEQDKSIG